MAAPGFPNVPSAAPAWSQMWGLRVSEVVNMLAAKINCAADLTLAANAAATTMVDARLSAFSALTFMPTTANAAAALSGLYVTGQRKGQATINHANNAQVDKTFRVAIHG